MSLTAGEVKLALPQFNPFGKGHDDSLIVPRPNAFAEKEDDSSIVVLPRYNPFKNEANVRPCNHQTEDGVTVLTLANPFAPTYERRLRRHSAGGLIVLPYNNPFAADAPQPRSGEASEDEDEEMITLPERNPFAASDRPRRRRDEKGVTIPPTRNYPAASEGSRRCPPTSEQERRILLASLTTRRSHRGTT
ncbi:hypothetical protein BDV93DRAFT_510710 [Ceratobasidium sp. AG-I]|nr:hypothetical protein BDV93DRAFT_510710 [Ceratobasidium sp. AG-I]